MKRTHLNRLAAWVASLESTFTVKRIFRRRLAPITFLAALAAAAPLAQGQARFNGFQSTIASGFQSGASVAVDGSGNLYVADAYSFSVLKETYHANGTYTQSVVVSGLGFDYGVAVDASGNVYVSDASNNRILKETPSGSSYTQTVIPNQRFI